MNDIEKIQKVSLRIILADDYRSYDLACESLNVEKLSTRRLDLCTNFASKLFKSDRSSEFFTPASIRLNPRLEPKLVAENMCRTKMCYNAPHNI